MDAVEQQNILSDYAGLSREKKYRVLLQIRHQDKKCYFIMWRKWFLQAAIEGDPEIIQMLKTMES